MPWLQPQGPPAQLSQLLLVWDPLAIMLPLGLLPRGPMPRGSGARAWRLSIRRL